MLVWIAVQKVNGAQPANAPLIDDGLVALLSQGKILSRAMPLVE
jgi:hypothetical protein